MGVIESATLTLLGLIIGFTFAMAIARYDLRKTYEEAEANAIGTEYLRAELLDPKSNAKVKSLLSDYLTLRIDYYREHDKKQVNQLNMQTIQIQTQLWNEVASQARSTPNPITALAAAGMNDVLNSQGYTQAAWWNRIPLAAWTLMMAIAICSNMLVGFGARNFMKNIGLFMIFPLVVSTSFFLIADIDSPRGGIIRVEPHNLMELQKSLHFSLNTEPPMQYNK